MRRPGNPNMPPTGSKAEVFDAGHRTAEFCAELDALLSKYGAGLFLIHDGKWAHVQLQWPDVHGAAASLMRAKRGQCDQYTSPVIPPCPSV